MKTHPNLNPAIVALLLAAVCFNAHATEVGEAAPNSPYPPSNKTSPRHSSSMRGKWFTWIFGPLGAHLAARLSRS